MSGVSNHDTGKIYEFSGPPANETVDRECKMPVTELVSEDSAAAIELAPYLKKTIVKVTAAHNIAFTADVSACELGDELIIIPTSDGTDRTISFGTGFTDAGNLNSENGAVTVICFVFDGTTFVETSRVETPAG